MSSDLYKQPRIPLSNGNRFGAASHAVPANDVALTLSAVPNENALTSRVSSSAVPSSDVALTLSAVPANEDALTAHVPSSAVALASNDVALTSSAVSAAVVVAPSKPKSAAGVAKSVGALPAPAQGRPTVARDESARQRVQAMAFAAHLDRAVAAKKAKGVSP